jgi:site-specific DNA-methyltransferase (adenine-specific)
MGETVFSNTRTLIQPEFILPEGLVLNTPQVMDGFRMLDKIPEESVPLVIFDPQYRTVLEKLSYGNEGERQKQRSRLKQMDPGCIASFISIIEEILMPSGHLMLWIDKFILCNGVSDILPSVTTLKNDLPIVDMITWHKGRIGMGYRSRRCAEHLMIFQKPPVRAKGVWQLHDIPDVWTEKADKTHPHAKPVGLLEKLIRAVTNEGDLVVDPAAGGYNTLRAARNTGRNFLGCDLDEAVVD